MSDGVGAVEVGRKKPDMGDGRGLGHAIPLANEYAGERGETAWKFGGERRGSGLDPLNAVVLGELSSFRGLTKRVHCRWNQRHHGDGFAREQ